MRNQWKILFPETGPPITYSCGLCGQTDYPDKTINIFILGIIGGLKLTGRPINIENICFEITSVIIHELIHSLGFHCWTRKISYYKAEEIAYLSEYGLCDRIPTTDDAEFLDYSKVPIIEVE